MKKNYSLNLIIAFPKNQAGKLIKKIGQNQYPILTLTYRKKSSSLDTFTYAIDFVLEDFLLNIYFSDNYLVNLNKNFIASKQKPI